MNNENKILIGLHRNASAFDKKTTKIAKKYNITLSQFMVLEALYSKGDMSVGEVRDKILSSVGTIPLIINNLEKRHYVQRFNDKNDKRITILHLTKEGYDVISKIAPLNNEMILNQMNILTEDEKNNLVNLLKKLGDSFNE